MAAIFDTLHLARRLQDAGVPAHQAEAASAGLSEVLIGSFNTLARREDLRTESSLRRAELDQRCAELRAEMAQLASELRAEIEQLRAEMREGFAELRGQIRLLQWMFATLLAGVGALLVGVGTLLLRSYA